MKKSFKAPSMPNFASMWIIALIALIGLGMTGCDSPAGPDQGQQNKNVDPVVADFNISGLSAIADGNPKAVTITPKTGKSTGQITIYYEGTGSTTYPKSTTAPSASGTYAVTFNVAAATGFNAKTGLSAGTLTISQQSPNPVDPVASDFNISGLEAIANGQPKAVSITPKASKSTGQITIWYTGTSGTVYSRTNTAPSAVGSYAVTFDVAVALGFNAKTGLIAGTLVISSGQTEKEPITDPHIIIDFENDMWNSGNYNQRAVKYEKFDWSLAGVVTTTDDGDHYDGTKSIRFRGNVETDNHFIELQNYINGVKTVYFDYASYSTHEDGGVALYYQIKDSGTWTKAGEVSAPAWNGNMLTAKYDLNREQGVRIKIVREGNIANRTSVNVDNIIIVGTSESSFDVNEVPQANDFSISGLSADADGTPKEVSITPKEGKSQGQITIWYAGAGDTIYARTQSAPSAAGRYAVTFDVAAAPGYDKADGLVAGTLVINEVIIAPHIIIDFENSEWAGGSYTTPKKLTDLGCEWEFIGYTTMDPSSDRRDGDRSVRLRGNSGDNCYVELLSYIKGIKSVSFDYGSFGAHNGGTVVLYYQIKGSGTWTKAGEITSPLWTTINAMLTADFNINKTDSVRFKIIREGDLAGNSTVNIDNIKIIGTGTGETLEIEEPDPETPVATDFTITGLTATYDGDPKEVSITPKAGKSQGDITIYYAGTDGTTYAISETAPSAVGKYAVTFDVEAAAGFTAVSGLIAGTLVISENTGGGTGTKITIDFEDTAWGGTGNGSYNNRTLTSNSHTWSVSAVTNPDNNDRRDGTRSARFRGNATDGTANPNRVEMTSYISGGIKSISFDYASYSSHSGGVIVLSYQTQGSSTWTEAGRVTAPAWGTAMLTTSDFAINTTQATRFKIEKESVSGSTSVNIDNIVITCVE